MYNKLACKISTPKWVLYLLLGSILLVGTACTRSNSDQITLTQTAYLAQPNKTEPPLLPTNTPDHSAIATVQDPIDNSNMLLSKNQWLLSGIVYRGENKEISALYPTYFQFDKNLLLITTPCEGTDNLIRGLGFEIIFQDEQYYMLNSQDMDMVDCGEMIDAQSEHLRVLDTSHYEIQDDKLILSGTQIQIVMERDNSNR